MKIRLLLLGMLSLLFLLGCSNDADDTNTPVEDVTGGDDDSNDDSGDDEANGDGDEGGDDSNDDGMDGDGEDDGNGDDTEAIIFTGEPITFTKANNADFTQTENQDMITESVIITRGDNRGIFNIAQESAFDAGGGGRNSPSPVGTLWAVGTTSDDLSSLTFAPWAETVNTVGGPRDAADNRISLVMQLPEENIFIDVVFTSWTSGRGEGGGGFSYERSTQE